uniref:Uncharacterized protein n=1 Tax=Trichogramma kaykai TaxID=54128 RepID=A0ABD2WXS2_9HYME
MIVPAETMSEPELCIGSWARKLMIVCAEKHAMLVARRARARGSTVQARTKRLVPTNQNTREAVTKSFKALSDHRIFGCGELCPVSTDQCNALGHDLPLCLLAILLKQF